MLFLLGSALSCLLDVSVGLKTGGYSNVLSGLIVSVSIPVGIILIFEELIKKENGGFVRIIKFYGKNSLIVLCVHPTLLLLFSYPFSSEIVGLSAAIQIVLAVIVLICLIVAEIPFIHLLQKYFPVLVGLERKTKRNL